MKNRIVPSNMKPLKPIRSMSSHQSEHQAEVFYARYPENYCFTFKYKDAQRKRSLSFNKI